MAKFSISVKAGHFVTGGVLRQVIERRYDPTLNRAGTVMREAIRSVEPVVSGNLRAHTNYSRPVWVGTLRRITLSANTPYARRVNATSHRNRGFWQRGISKGRSATVGELQRGKKALADALWIK